ncbi:MAG: DUF1287 domain-containing protein [Bacteroidota bacterium]
MAKAAESIIDASIFYYPNYVSIPYPNGDVDPKTGVCTDVIIRSYRKLEIDLQKRVHEDMKLAWSAYPKNWGLKGPDSNIDHRRVPNLITFFKRHGQTLNIGVKGEVYKPGDIVVWDLGGGILHIGLVSNQKVNATTRNLIVHNIGGGQVAEDVLFEWKIIGHFSYLPIN